MREGTSAATPVLFSARSLHSGLAPKREEAPSSPNTVTVTQSALQ